MHLPITRAEYDHLTRSETGQLFDLVKERNKAESDEKLATLKALFQVIGNVATAIARRHG